MTIKVKKQSGALGIESWENIFQLMHRERFLEEMILKQVLKRLAELA